MVNCVGLFAEVGVVEPRVVFARKGEAEIIVACVEFRELALDGQRERFPFRGFEPCEIEGTADFWLVGLLLFQGEDGLAVFLGPGPRGRIGKRPCVRCIEGMNGFGGEEEAGGEEKIEQGLHGKTLLAT